jgi:hypothetical protein
MDVETLISKRSSVGVGDHVEHLVGIAETMDEGYWVGHNCSDLQSGE